MATIRPTPLEFVKTREGVEGVVMHIGLNNTQLVLVAGSGEWTRYVVDSVEAAKEACERLKLTCHDGYPDHLRQAMSKWKREKKDWEDAPYPERYRETYK